MGYIIPLTNYQQMNYVERNLIRGRNPYQYEAISKVKALTNPDDGGNTPKSSSERTTRPSLQVQMDTSQLTGKGILFDVYV